MAAGTMSRRAFVEAAGAVAGVSALGLATSAASADEAAAEEAAPKVDDYDVFGESRVVWQDIPASELEATYDYDVVVIGAGTAGVTAAFAAADNGASKVAVLQDSSIAVSQGNMGSGLILDQSTDYGLARFIHDWNENNYYACDYFMVENYVKYSGYAVEYLAALAKEAGFPDENTMVSDDIIDYGDGEQVCSRRLLFADKPITYGDAMQQITTIGPDHNVDFYFSTPGVKLAQDESGRVTGAYGKSQESGKYILLNASTAVIIASGCFTNNQAMLARYCTAGLGYTAKVAGRYGDGQLMGVLAGGVLPNGIYSKMCHDNDTGPFQNIPGLGVDYDGKRFINEEVDSTLWCNISKTSQVKGRWFKILDSHAFEQNTELGGRPVDEESIKAYMPGTEEAAAKGAYGAFVATYVADTLDDLADQLGIPADALKETVEHYNELCAAGKDTDFGKQAKYLFPVQDPPFYGINIWSRLSTILAGLNIDKYQRVVDAEGQPIPGLYAAGNCSGTPCGQSDWRQVSLGESLGFAFTEGYVAGMHAVGALAE